MFFTESSASTRSGTEKKSRINESSQRKKDCELKSEISFGCVKN